GGRTTRVGGALPGGLVPRTLGFDYRHEGEAGGTVTVWAAAGAGDDPVHVAGPSVVPNLARHRSLGTIYVGWCPYPGLRAAGLEPRRSPDAGIGEVTLRRR
ncbi:MAG: hypothetical protein ACKOTZ_09910, partial [Chloroflexota bacterium]